MIQNKCYQKKSRKTISSIRSLLRLKQIKFVATSMYATHGWQIPLTAKYMTTGKTKDEIEKSGDKERVNTDTKRMLTEGERRMLESLS